jgi:triosephosphate isomerase
MRRPLIAGNWKMHLDASSAQKLARDVVSKTSRFRHCDIVLLPAFPLIPLVARVVAGSHVAVGAQDLSPEEEGAFTGDVSAKMLLSVDCTHVVIGHSERREYHLETDELVSRKVRRALMAGLIPIVCVGEKLQEREAQKTLERVERQVTVALSGVEEKDVSKVVIAYEPVWAIGTGRTATPAQAEEVHEFIRGLLSRLYSYSVAQETRVIYGGSVKPDNIKALMAEKDIDGALVGGASLDADGFASIVAYKE